MNSSGQGQWPVVWAIVNTELNFGMNGRCGVHGQLSNHYHLKDYEWKQFFGEEKKRILHNIIFSTFLLLPPSQPKHFVPHWALQHPQTRTFSGVLVKLHKQLDHTTSSTMKKRTVYCEMEWIKERSWSHTVSSCQYVDIRQQWFNKTMTGLMPWLKRETSLKYMEINYPLRHQALHCHDNPPGNFTA